MYQGYIKINNKDELTKVVFLLESNLKSFSYALNINYPYPYYIYVHGSWYTDIEKPNASTLLDIVEGNEFILSV